MSGAPLPQRNVARSIVLRSFKGAPYSPTGAWHTGGATRLRDVEDHQRSHLPADLDVLADTRARARADASCKSNSCGADGADLGQEFGKKWPDSGSIFAKFGRARPELAGIDRVWADAGRVRTDVDQTWANVGQQSSRAVVRLGPRLARCCQKFTRPEPKLTTQANFDRTPNLGRCGHLSGRTRLGQIRANSVSKFSPSRPKFGRRVRIWPGICRTLPGIVQCPEGCPELAKKIAQHGGRELTLNVACPADDSPMHRTPSHESSPSKVEQAAMTHAMGLRFSEETPTHHVHAYVSSMLNSCSSKPASVCARSSGLSRMPRHTDSKTKTRVMMS